MDPDVFNTRAILTVFANALTVRCLAAITLSLQRVVPKVAVRGEAEETATINFSHLTSTSTISLEILDQDLATVAVSIQMDADNTVISRLEAHPQAMIQIMAMGGMTVEMVDQTDLADQADLVDLAILTDQVDQGGQEDQCAIEHVPGTDASEDADTEHLMMESHAIVGTMERQRSLTVFQGCRKEILQMT